MTKPNLIFDLLMSRLRRHPPILHILLQRLRHPTRTNSRLGRWWRTARWRSCRRAKVVSCHLDLGHIGMSGILLRVLFGHFLGVGAVRVDCGDGEGVALFVASIRHRCDFDEGMQGDLALAERKQGAYFDVWEFFLRKSHEVRIETSKDGLSVS